MGRALAETFPIVRDTFAEADDVLGDHLSRLCFQGPEAALTETVNTQPAILTLSVAVARLLEAEGLGPPVIAAGHSLGEYSALVAAGVLAFPDALRLVRIRGAAMQEAVPPGKGTMAAIIGLEREEVEVLCRKLDAGTGRVLQLANINARDQIVVAGHRDCVEEIVGVAEAAGARKVIPLAVSGPFHCRLMEPAGQILARALEPMSLKDFRFPVVANVTGKPVEEPSRVKDLLVQQVFSPVQWTATMESLIDAGIEAAVEVGPGRVLSGLMRRHCRQVKTFHVEDPESLEKALKALAGERGGPIG
jgi:[acyl-carrier-protein] S-malonyltransferase